MEESGGSSELLPPADAQGGPASTDVLEGGRPRQGGGQVCSHIPGHQGFVTLMKTKPCLFFSFLSFFFFLHGISAKSVTKPVVMNAEGRAGGEGE